MTQVMPMRVRSVIDRLGLYRPPVLPVSAEGKTIRLAANEAGYAPLPAVQEAIAAAAKANRYPDNACAELVTALSRQLDLPAEHIVAGAGSIGVLHSLSTAVCEPGSNVVYGWRSFEAYPVLIEWSGAQRVPVALSGERLDLAAIARNVDDQTRMVLICNPNNPTGTALSAAELSGFLADIPPDVLVVLDEAYHDFAGDEAADGVELSRRWPNIVVLRTFSKAHALAGLRVGYLVSSPPVTQAVRKAQVPFAVSHVAQAAAVEALRHPVELAQRVRAVVAERERVQRALAGAGLSTPVSHGNFVWLALGHRCGALVAACATAGVAVQHFGDEGVRASIGTPEENDAFLAAVRAFMAG